MLTLFTVPRAFTGDVRIAQDNAIGSWTRLPAPCEVILFGNDPGIAEASKRHQTTHVPDLPRTLKGTPTLSDVFARAAAIAKYPMLCFVNSDIILLNDFVAAVRAVSATCPNFLIVSSRFNCRIEQPLSFPSGWNEQLRERARGDGRMYPAGGSDIFVYPRGLFASIPPFAIGRGYWDNWLMYRAAQSSVPLIDATSELTALHQDHDYSHVSGMTLRSDISALLASEEAKSNLDLAGGPGHLFTVYDATHILNADGRLVSTLRPPLILRRIKAWLRRTLSRIGVIRR